MLCALTIIGIPYVNDIAKTPSIRMSSVDFVDLPVLISIFVAMSAMIILIIVIVIIRFLLSNNDSNLLLVTIAVRMFLVPLPSVADNIRQAFNWSPVKQFIGFVAICR